jgi:hypothetical protein
LEILVSLKFMDHDITDEQTFPELARKILVALRAYQVQELASISM